MDALWVQPRGFREVLRGEEGHGGEGLGDERLPVVEVVAEERDDVEAALAHLLGRGVVDVARAPAQLLRTTFVDGLEPGMVNRRNTTRGEGMGLIASKQASNQHQPT